MSEQYDLLKSILLEKSVRTGTFTLASGKVSDLYVDCRMTALDPVGATLVGALGWKLVPGGDSAPFPGGVGHWRNDHGRRPHFPGRRHDQRSGRG